MLRHECVVVPGIGALIARRVTAFFDEERGIMTPPRRELGFNGEIADSDGLIAASIARAEGIGFNEAAAIVDEECGALRAQLDADGEVALGHLGMLRSTPEAIIFEPRASTSIAPRLIGLPEVNVSPIELTSVPAPEEQRPRWRETVKRTLRVAASIAVVLSLGAMLTTPVLDHRAELASFGRSLLADSTAAAPAPAQRSGQPTGLFIAIPDPSTSTIDWTPAPQPEPQTTVAGDPRPDRYFLVIASLPSRVQAEKYMSALPDSASFKVMYSGSRYRIYAASAPTYAGAYAGLTPELASRFPDAWVCRP